MFSSVADARVDQHDQSFIRPLALLAGPGPTPAGRSSTTVSYDMRSVCPDLLGFLGASVRTFQTGRVDFIMSGLDYV